MLTRSELPENPVTLGIIADDGQRLTVRAERLRSGKIRMDCSCAANSAEGWCWHEVELLCMRYDAVAERSEALELQFEDVVMGTSLADLADELYAGLADYRRSLQNVCCGLPAGVDGHKLDVVNGLASELADAAKHLDHAIGRFRRRLTAAREG